MVTSYGTSLPGYPGQRVGVLNHGARTYVNDRGATAQASDLTLTIANSVAYTFTVDGQTVTYTSSAAATAAEVRDGLVAAGRALGGLAATVAFNPIGTKVRVSAKIPGVGFTLAESDARIAVAVVAANGTPEPIPFGLAVVKRTGAGTTDRSCTLPSAAGETFLGVVERTPSNIDPLGAYAGDRAAPFSTLSVGQTGTWLVQVETAVAAEDPVFFRHTATGSQQVGAWRNDADTATADEVTGARFKNSALAGGYAELALRRP